MTRLTAVHIKVLVEGERAELMLARLGDALGKTPDRNVPDTAQFVLDDYDSAPDATAAVRAILDQQDPNWHEVLLLG